MYYCERAGYIVASLAQWPTAVPKKKKHPWGPKSIFQIDHYIKCVCEKAERKPQEADKVKYSSALVIFDHKDLIFGGCTMRMQNRKGFTLREQLNGCNFGK